VDGIKSIKREVGVLMGKIRTIARRQQRDYLDAPPLERWGVICDVCKKKFETISDAVKVPCPYCNNQTDRIKKDKIINKKEVENDG